LQGGETFPDRAFYAGSVQPQIRKDDRLLAMIDEAIGQPQLQNRTRNTLTAEKLEHGATGSTHDGGFLDRHKSLVSISQALQQSFVQWLDETHVDQGGVERVGRQE